MCLQKWLVMMTSCTTNRCIANKNERVRCHIRRSEIFKTFRVLGTEKSSSDKRKIRPSLRLRCQSDPNAQYLRSSVICIVNLNKSLNG